MRLGKNIIFRSNSNVSDRTTCVYHFFNFFSINFLYSYIQCYIVFSLLTKGQLGANVYIGCQSDKLGIRQVYNSNNFGFVPTNRKKTSILLTIADNNTICRQPRIPI